MRDAPQAQLLEGAGKPRPPVRLTVFALLVPPRDFRNSLEDVPAYKDSASAHILAVALPINCGDGTLGCDPGATVATDFTTSDERSAAGLQHRDPSLAVTTRVVSGGTMAQSRGKTTIIPWNAIDTHRWHDDAVTA